MTPEQWQRFHTMTDDEIDTSDIPELTGDFWKNARLVLPKSKTPVSLRLDDDMLAWFKRQGPGYQSRINAVLRAYMEAHRREKR